MDSVQRLRAQAQKAGNLKSNEQVKVSTEPMPPREPDAPPPQAPPPTQVIIIEPAQPEVVYVPTYNPTVVYGVWPYPAYPPYYYPPPPVLVLARRGGWHRAWAWASAWLHRRSGAG